MSLLLWYNMHPVFYKGNPNYPFTKDLKLSLLFSAVVCFIHLFLFFLLLLFCLLCTLFCTWPPKYWLLVTLLHYVVFTLDKTQQNLTGSSEGTLKGESCKPFCVLTFDLLHVPGWLLLTPKGSPTPSWGSTRRAVDAEFLFENLPYVPDLTRFFRISRSRLIRFHVLFFYYYLFFFI